MAIGADISFRLHRSERYQLFATDLLTRMLHLISCSRFTIRKNIHVLYAVPFNVKCGTRSRMRRNVFVFTSYIFDTQQRIRRLFKYDTVHKCLHAHLFCNHLYSATCFSTRRAHNNRHFSSLHADTHRSINHR